MRDGRARTGRARPDGTAPSRRSGRGRRRGEGSGRRATRRETPRTTRGPIGRGGGSAKRVRARRDSATRRAARAGRVKTEKEERIGPESAGTLAGTVERAAARVDRTGPASGTPMRLQVPVGRVIAPASPNPRRRPGEDLDILSRLGVTGRGEGGASPERRLRRRRKTTSAGAARRRAATGIAAPRRDREERAATAPPRRSAKRRRRRSRDDLAATSRETTSDEGKAGRAAPRGRRLAGWT